MNQKKFCILLLFFTFFSGCAATDEKWNGLKFGKNYSHAANQTLNYSVQWVDEATLRVLDQMEIMIIDNYSSPAGNSIKAATIYSDILIELISLAPNSTQMKINVQYSDSHKNKSTANEIFYQTRQILLSNKRLEKTELEEPIESIKEIYPTE